jgi:hypothetical protein
LRDYLIASSCGGRVGDHLITSFRRERANSRAIRAVLYHASISQRKLAKAHRERQRRKLDGHPIIGHYVIGQRARHQRAMVMRGFGFYMMKIGTPGVC